MFCKNCGKKIRENAKFCSNCGGVVEEEKQIVEASFVEKDDNEKIEEIKEEEKQEMIFCRNCGKSIPKDSVVCSKCGFHFNSSNNNSGDTFENILVCAVSFFIPIAGFILWIILKNDDKSKAKNALIASLISIGLWFLLFLLIFIFVIVVLISAA